MLMKMMIIIIIFFFYLWRQLQHISLFSVFLSSLIHLFMVFLTSEPLFCSFLATYEAPHVLSHIKFYFLPHFILSPEERLLNNHVTINLLVSELFF